MTTIPLSESGETPFQRLIGHNPKILQDWTALEETLLIGHQLSSELLEEVRRTLAFGNKCEYCMAKGRPKGTYVDKKEQLATAFADLFAKDIDSISEVHFEILREEFSNAEILHLCSFISFISASQKLGKIFKIR